MSDTIDLTPIKVSGPQDDSIDLTPKNSPLPPKESADAINLVKKLSPNPDEAQKKLDLAKNLSPSTGMSEWFIFKNAEAVSAKLYGNPSENPGSASSKLDATIKDVPLNQQINARWAQQMREGETPEGQQEIKELQAKRVSNGKGVWSFIVNAASGMVIQGQSLLRASVPPPIGGGKDAMDAYYQTQLKNSDELVGSMTGEMYGSLREQGVSAKSAKAASGVMIAAQVALNTLSVSKVPGVGRALEDLGKAGAKALASGQIAKAIGVQVGKGYAEQGAVAIVNNATAVIIPEFARLLDDDVKKGNISQPDAAEILKQFGEGVLMQTLVMGTVSAGLGAAGAARAARSKFAEESAKIAAEADKLPAEAPSGAKAASSGKEGEVPSMRLAEEAKAKAAQAKAERDAKATVAAMPADQLEKPIPFEDVPRGTSGDLEAFRAFVKENNPEADKAAIDTAGLETLKRNNPNGWEEFSKSRPVQVDPLDKQVAEDPRVIAAKEQAPALQKAIDEEMAKPEPDQTRVKALQDTLNADSTRVSHIENQVYQEKFTEQHPEVVAARQALEAAKMDPTQTDKVASLQEALDSARKEANKMAAIRGATRVASERARVDRLETKHKAIDILKGVDPDTFDKASGDTIRQIQEHFAKPEPAVKPGETKPEPKVLDLDSLKSALADAKAAHEDIAPEIEDALSGMPSTYSKLSPEQLQGLVAVVKNLQKIKSLKGKIHTAEGWVERANLQADAEKSIALPKTSKLGTGATILKNKAKAVARVLTNSFSMNGELVFGGKSTLVHKVAVQDVLNSHSDYLKESTRQQEPTRAYLRGNLKIDEQRTPLKWQKYWSDQFTEDGVTLTRGEIMDNYMSFQNENQKASLLDDGTTYASHVTEQGNPADVEKIPEATYQKLFSHLGKPELDLIGIAQKQLAENGEGLSFYHENRYGTPIKQEPNYWPKYVKREGATYDQDITDIQKANRFLRTNPDESSLISRTGGKGATYTTGFWNKFSESTDSSARILKMGDAVSSSAKVLHDPVIADKVAKTYGGSVLKQLREDLAAEAGQRETPREIEKAMDALGNLATNLHLGIVSSLKVPWKLAGLGVRSFINNPHGFLPGVMETLIHPKKTAAAARTFSSMVDEAYKHGGTVDLGQLTQYATKAGKVRAVGRKIQNINMSLTRAGSNLGYVWDATAARHEAEYQFDRALKGKQMDPDFKAVTGVSENQVATLTPEQKMAAVGHYADGVIGESHAVNDPGYKLGLQKSAAGRLVTKFKTEPLKGFEQTRRLAMRFARNPNFSTAGKLFSAITIYGAVEGALIYGINEGVNAMFGVKSKSPQTLGDEEVAADLSYIPLVGDAINEHLYLAKHPGVASQANAVESMAVLPLNTILDCAVAIDPQYTPAQRKAATKRIARDMKSIFNVPINLGNMGGP